MCAVCLDNQRWRWHNKVSPKQEAERIMSKSCLMDKFLKLVDDTSLTGAIKNEIHYLAEKASKQKPKES
jgi:hypothetical protein